ncbi:hypothetical protein ABE096_21550 [Robertmurraya massiliosenegalensis]|uniref:hypothetical protein n=1 Tax=Robertmurraya TaxID=2837507 RepID=UPI0039A499E1
MALYIAHVKIRGIRPFIFNRFTEESISLPHEKKDLQGVAGKNPMEWKKTFNATREGELYIDGSYIHRCLINAAKFTKRGLQAQLAATLETVDDYLFFTNRSLPTDLNVITRNSNSEVYIDVRSVKMQRTSARHIRYRLALSKGWELSFSIIWEATVVGKELMESVCNDAGFLVGIGDNRVNGFGRFEVLDFKAERVSSQSA